MTSLRLKGALVNALVCVKLSAKLAKVMYYKVYALLYSYLDCLDTFISSYVYVPNSALVPLRCDNKLHVINHVDILTLKPEIIFRRITPLVKFILR